MQETTEQIQNFLQFITLQFIQHPDQAQLKVTEVGQEHVRFRLILDSSDVSILIGRNGFTASAIRNILKAAAIRDGITATLQIASTEEENARIEAIKAGKLIDDSHTLGHHDEADDEHLEET